jgi:hypothetical protein
MAQYPLLRHKKSLMWRDYIIAPFKVARKKLFCPSRAPYDRLGILYSRVPIAAYAVLAAMSAS